MLFALAAIGTILAGLGHTWTLAAQRERETELLFIGQQFSQALLSYRNATPAGQPDAPARLEELLEDKRFPYPVRHLRKLYVDPFSEDHSWALEIMDGRIAGVHSHARKHPVRETVPDGVVIVAGDSGHPQYADWRFRPPAKQKTVPQQSQPSFPR